MHLLLHHSIPTDDPQLRGCRHRTKGKTAPPNRRRATSPSNRRMRIARTYTHASQTIACVYNTRSATLVAVWLSIGRLGLRGTGPSLTYIRPRPSALTWDAGRDTHTHTHTHTQTCKSSIRGKERLVPACTGLELLTGTSGVMWEVVGIVVCKLMTTGAGVVNDIRYAGLTREYRTPPAGRYVTHRALMHTPASAKNRLCPYRWYYTSVPTGIHQPAYGRPASAGRCVKKPDSLKILAPCGTQASIKKLLINTGVGPRVHGPQFHLRIRLSLMIPRTPTSRMGPLEVLYALAVVCGSELNRLRCLVHSRLGGLGRNHSTW